MAGALENGSRWRMAGAGKVLENFGLSGPFSARSVAAKAACL
jgi:hypothetical protein